MGNKDPSALKILINPIGIYSVIIIVALAVVAPEIAGMCILAWVILIGAILLGDRRRWGVPGPETEGIWLSSQTRNIELSDYTAEGLVMGSCVKVRNMFSAARAESRAIVGGEALQFTSLVEETKNIAINRMCQQARNMGCNGVIGYRMVSAETLWGATEIIAYGTAIRIGGMDDA